MNFDHQEMFETLALSEEVRIRYKTESRLMRILGKLMFWDSGFMTNVTTTLGFSVYFPSPDWVKADYRRAWQVLSHELVHVEDAEKQGLWFSLGYAMPQCLAVLSILALTGAVWTLAFLLFALPWPALWRKRSEMRGYGMTMAVEFWYRGSISETTKEGIAAVFTGPAYYFMWPFRKAVRAELEGWVSKIQQGQLEDEGAVYGRVKQMIRARGSK